jgi:L-asparagine transporter-like permease
LALFGLGTTTGTGFLLGSSLAIEKGGFSVILNFLLAAVGTFIVFQALAKMIAQHSEKGSFRTYSKQAFGHWAGFSHGWVYWSSEMLILGSQLTAIGLFTRFWFPNLPLWMLTSGYAVLGVGVVLLGTAGYCQSSGNRNVYPIGLPRHSRFSGFGECAYACAKFVSRHLQRRCDGRLDKLDLRFLLLFGH